MNERYPSSRAEKLRKRGIPIITALGGGALLSTIGAIDAYSKTIDTCVSASEQITIQNGDTIWDIAKTYAPNADPRDTIYNIKQDNPDAFDRASAIQPGKTLSIEVCLPDQKLN